jgi:hypothetical protein
VAGDGVDSVCVNDNGALGGREQLQNDFRDGDALPESGSDGQNVVGLGESF